MRSRDTGSVLAVPDVLTDAIAALGGAPVGPGTDASVESEKAAAKRHKREARLRKDAERRPDSFERFKILMEVLSEGRQVVELTDHKARYALVILGLLNAAVFFVLARANLISEAPRPARPWLIGFLIVYAALTFVFVYHAIEVLKPRRMRYQGELGNPEGPLGVIFWETAAAEDVEAYRLEWAQVRMGQINAELVLIAHRLARLISAKYAALTKLYAGLMILVSLAMLILVVYTAIALVH